MDEGAFEHLLKITEAKDFHHQDTKAQSFTKNIYCRRGTRPQ
jgi:hypothetical protein